MTTFFRDHEAAIKKLADEEEEVSNDTEVHG